MCPRRSSTTLLRDQVAHRALRLDPRGALAPVRPDRSADHACRHEFSEAIGGLVDPGQPGDGTPSVGHDDLSACTDNIQVLAETVLQLSDADLGT